MGKIGQILEDHLGGASFDVKIASEIPESSGLGSSAALAVGLATGFGLPVSVAKAIENVFHGPSGSGLDVEVCKKGGVQQYRKGLGLSETNLRIGKVLLIDSGTRKKGGTKSAIDLVRAKWE